MRVLVKNITAFLFVAGGCIFLCFLLPNRMAKGAKVLTIKGVFDAFADTYFRNVGRQHAEPGNALTTGTWPNAEHAAEGEDRNMADEVHLSLGE